jgi:hypothetical protein
MMIKIAGTLSNPIKYSLPFHYLNQLFLAALSMPRGQPDRLFYLKVIIGSFTCYEPMTRGTIKVFKRKFNRLELRLIKRRSLVRILLLPLV